MRITTSLNYATDPQTAAAQARELEAAGVDRIWIPEAYGFDAVSLLGYLAASTSTVELASGILNTTRALPPYWPRRRPAWMPSPVAGSSLASAPPDRR